MAGWESTASVRATGLAAWTGPQRNCFICDDDPAAGVWRPAWRSAVFHGRYVDAAGFARLALVKAFRTPDAFQREVMGLSVAGLLGVGPALLMPEGVRWPGRAGFRLPDGACVGEGSLLVCEEDVGVSLRALIRARARWRAGAGADEGGVARATDPAVPPCGASADSTAPAGGATPEDDPVLLAYLDPDGWDRLCDKVLLDLCEQVDALHNGLNEGKSPLVHGDIKPENVCVRAYGPRPEDARATLIDFESAGRATQGSMAHRPSTPHYRAYLEEVSDPRGYDAGCVALVCYEMRVGELPRAELFSSWGLFRELPTAELFFYVPWRHVGTGDEGGHAFSNPDALFGVSAGAARRLGLTWVDRHFVSEDVRRIANRHMGRRVWVDQKDLREIGSDLAMGFTEQGAYFQKIAQAINACYNLAVSDGRWDRVQITEEEDPAIYAQNYEQAQAWFGYLTDTLGLEVVHAGEETGERVEQLSPAELMRLERLEHERWLLAKEAQGWRGLEPADEKRLADELGPAGAADPARRKRLLDSWKVNELMRPWDELSEDEQYMTRAMMESLVPVLAELGLSVCRA